MKWLEFDYNKPALTMNQRLHMEYQEENFIYQQDDNLHIKDMDYSTYDWENDIWNLKMELE